MSDMERIFSKRYDVTGNETLRIGKTFLLSRFIPLGNFSSGPNLRCLIVLIILHYFSGVGFWIQVRNERLVNRVYEIIKRGVKKIF